MITAFFERQLPPINSVLLAGERGQIVIEVLSQAGPQRVRGVALMPTEGLARGDQVEDTGAPLKAPLERASFREAIAGGKIQLPSDYSIFWTL